MPTTEELLTTMNTNVNTLIGTVNSGVTSWNASMNTFAPIREEVIAARGANLTLGDRFAPLESPILVDYTHSAGNVSSVTINGLNIAAGSGLLAECYWVTNSASASSSCIFMAINAVDSTYYSTIKTGTNYNNNNSSYNNNATYGTNVYGSWYTTYGYEVGFLLDASDVNFNMTQINFNAQTRQPYYMGFGLRHRMAGAFYNGYRSAAIASNTNISSLVFTCTNAAHSTTLSGIANGSRIVIRRLR